jgi:DNA-binding GntR family transcriptional regulator
MKAVSGIRLLIRIFAARREGHTLAVLKHVCRDHLDVLAAIRAGDPDAAAAILTRHISESRRSRLEEFDRREHEADLPQNIDAFLAEIESELA